jgi:hypothetical protein
MIVNKTLLLTGESSPFNYTIVQTSCVTSTPVSGVLENNVPINVVFDIASGCLNNNVKIIVTDKHGCITEKQFTILGECNLNVSIVKNNYEFTAIHNGTGLFTYQWIFDNTVFTTTSTTNPNLILTSTRSFENSTVNVIVTNNSNECTATNNIVFTACTGILLPIVDKTTCTPIEYISPVLTLSYKGCSTPDWNSINITPNSTFNGATWRLIPIDIVGNDYFFQIAFLRKDTLPDTYQFKASVINLTGESAETLIKLDVEICQQANGNITVIGSTHKPSTTVTTGYMFRIPISDNVYSTAAIDWSSFNFTPATGQTLVNPTSLTVTNGNVTLNSNREIQFTINSTISRGSEIVSWTIYDINGNMSNTANEIFIFDIPIAPDVLNDNLCTLINTNISLNSFFSAKSNGVSSNIIITVPPLHGIIINQSGAWYYQPFNNYLGADTFKYKIANSDGIYSLEATNDITVISSGVALTNNLIC